MTAAPRLPMDPCGSCAAFRPMEMNDVTPRMARAGTQRIANLLSLPYGLESFQGQGLHGREHQSVLRNAISAARSAGERLRPKACPLTARVLTPAPRNPV